jgi:23S rRNA (uracil1939-C5)-methyltransferase
LGPEEPEAAESEAYDLFAGVGLFSLPLCRRYRRVVAVEGDRVAGRFARKNAQENGVDNLTVESQAVESWIEGLPERPARVVVDPPRVGISPVVRKAILDRRPRRLTYVSCDSATLARDLSMLRTAYRITRLALLDMFPQTGHMEAVVQLLARDVTEAEEP